MNIILLAIAATVFSNEIYSIDKSCYELGVSQYVIKNRSRLLEFPVKDFSALPQKVKSRLNILFIKELGYVNINEVRISKIAELHPSNDRKIYEISADGLFKYSDSLEYRYTIYINFDGTILNKDELPAHSHFLQPINGITSQENNANKRLLIFSKKSDQFLYCEVKNGKIDVETGAYEKTTKFYQLSNGIQVMELKSTEYSDY